MGKIFNDIHFVGEQDFSIGAGLSALVTSGLLTKSPPTKFDKALSLGKSALTAGKNTASKLANSASKSTAGVIIRDKLDAMNSNTLDKYTRNGQARVRLSELLHPKNNNGLPLDIKLELSKINARLKTSGVPERHIEKATLMYIDALQQSGDQEIAKQFYLVTLRDRGVSGEHIVKCIKLSLGNTAIQWLKIAAGLGIGIAAAKNIVSVTGATTKLVGTALSKSNKLAGTLLKGAINIIK